MDLLHGKAEVCGLFCILIREVQRFDKKCAPWADRTPDLRISSV